MVSRNGMRDRRQDYMLNATLEYGNSFNNKGVLIGTFTNGRENISASTTDYNKLDNKPRINGVELINNKTSDELLLQDKMVEVTLDEIDVILQEIQFQEE